MVACPAAFGKLSGRFFEFMDMDGFPVDDGSSRHRSAANRSFGGRRQLAVVRRQPHDVAIGTKHLSAARVAKLRGIFRHRL